MLDVGPQLRVFDFDNFVGITVRGNFGLSGFKAAAKALDDPCGKIGFAVQGQVFILVVAGPLQINVVPYKVIDVLSRDHVLRGAGYFQDASHLLAVRYPGADPDALDKIEIYQQAGKKIGVPCVAQGRLTDKDTDEITIFVLLDQIDIIAGHQLIRFYHGRFGFVLVPAFRQRHQLANPEQDPVIVRQLVGSITVFEGRVVAGSAGIGPQQAACFLENRPVGAFLSMGLQSVSQLMGHFMVENFTHRIPGIIQDEFAADADLIALAIPVSPAAVHVDQAEEGPLHQTAMMITQVPERRVPLPHQPK